MDGVTEEQIAAAGAMNGRVAGGTMPDALLDLPGHERLAHFVQGEAPLSGIQLLTGVRPVSGDRSKAVFRMTVSDSVLDADGKLPIGMIATLADGALGWAVVGALPSGSACATVNLSLSFARRVQSGAVLTAESTLISCDDRSALSQAVITNERGDAVAYGHARSVVFGSPRTPKARSPEAAVTGQVAPKAPVGIGPEPTGGSSGQHHLDLAAHPRFGGPVHGLLGLDVRAASPGRVVLAVAAGKHIEQTMGAVQGGALALLADRAMASAVLTGLEHDAGAQLMDVHMQYARSVAADDRPLLAVAEVQHLGRRLALVSVVIRNASSDVVAFGTGTVRVAR